MENIDLHAPLEGETTRYDLRVKFNIPTLQNLYVSGVKELKISTRDDGRILITYKVYDVNYNVDFPETAIEQVEVSKLEIQSYGKPLSKSKKEVSQYTKQYPDIDVPTEEDIYNEDEE